MIPIAIAAGFVVGIRQLRWPWVLGIGALWALLITFRGDDSLAIVVIWTVGLAYGAVNAAVGWWAGGAIARFRERRANPEGEASS